METTDTNNRKTAISWWNNLNEKDKVEICNSNSDILKGIRNWTSLTGREIEMLYKFVFTYTLFEIWETKLEIANKKGLTMFCFEHLNKIYLSEWRKGRWNDPIIINKL